MPAVHIETAEREISEKARSLRLDPLHTTILVAFSEISRSAVSMCTAGILLFLVALWAAKTDFARARGLDKNPGLEQFVFRYPLAVFGAEHLSGAKFIMLGVPSYMPGRLFWAYFVALRCWPRP